MTRRLAASVLLFGACDVVLGLHPMTAVDAAAPTCDLTKAHLDPSGCPCETINAVQSCFLGDRGTVSRCAAGGVVTCQSDKTWTACAGATPPAPEVCFDATDNDCDAVVDNGCACAQGDNLCLDPATGTPWVSNRLVVNPPSLKAGTMFDVFGLSNSVEVTQASFRSDKGWCSGAGSIDCTLAGACAGWTGTWHRLPASVGSNSSDMFSSYGDHVVTLVVADQQPPCSTPGLVELSTTMTITP